MDRRLEQQLYKIQMANKYMKEYSTLLVTKENQIKTIK